MVNKGLISFIRDNTSQGYNMNEIRDHLLQSGYSPQQVQEAIDYYYNPPEKPKIPILPIIVAIILAGLLAAAAYFVFVVPKEAESVFEISVTPISERSLKPGEKFSFQYDIQSINTKSKSVDIKIEMIHRDTGRIVAQKSDMITMKQSKILNEFLDIPDDSPLGSYFVSAAVSYKGQEEKDSLVISLIEESPQATCVDGIKNQGETGTDCGGPCPACETCSDLIRNQDETGIDCGGVCSPCETVTTTITTTSLPAAPDGDDRPSWEILEEIHNLALEDPEKAGPECLKQRTDIKDKCLLDLVQITGNKITCQQITNPSKKDSCLMFAATIKEESNTCSEILSDSIRDQCYMDFILEKEQYEMCDMITNIYEKRACEGLKIARSS